MDNIIFLDTETTGFKEPRMIQLAYKTNKYTFESLYNPTRPIDEGATGVHGITDEKVADAPVFYTIAGALFRGMSATLAWKDKDAGPGYCYVGGYNVRFDMDVLDYSFDRIGAGEQFDPDNYTTLDAFDIFKRFNPRNLKAAVRHYTSTELEDAHQAAADIEGTKRVLEAQLSATWHKEDLPSTVPEIHELVSKKQDNDKIDRQGTFKWVGVDACAAFGSHVDLPMDMIPRGYYQWMLDGDFSPSTKRVVRAALRGEFPKR